MPPPFLPTMGGRWRTTSPSGGSTLITSAPASAIIRVHIGPDITIVKSSTVMPVSASRVVVDSDMDVPPVLLCCAQASAAGAASAMRRAEQHLCPGGTAAVSVAQLLGDEDEESADA